MKKFFNYLLALAMVVGGLCFTSCEETDLNGGTGNEVTPTTPVVKAATLCASASIILADGVDELVLSVMVGDVDVTDSAYLYVDNKRMTTNRFTATKAGSYKFFASYKGKITNQLIITAANPALYMELPADSMPEMFDGFERNVLIAEATGTWCGYCPYMIRALELFEEKGSNADNAVIVAMHSGDEFSNDASEAAVSASQVKGFPTCVLNLDPEVVVNSYNDAGMNSENINSAVGMELREAARVGIAAAVATNQDSTMVAVRAAVKVGKDGAYRINAWLIEDGVAASQSSYWYQFSNGKSSVVIDHKHILRGASTTSPIQGALLGGNEKSTAGEVVEFYHEFNTKKAVKKVANCKVLVLVTATNGTSSKYVVNNIVECPVGEAIPYAYKN